MNLIVAPSSFSACCTPAQEDWLKLLSLAEPTSVTSPTFSLAALAAGVAAPDDEAAADAGAEEAAAEAAVEGLADADAAADDAAAEAGAADDAAAEDAAADEAG